MSGVFTIEDLCEVQSGGTPSRSEPKYWNGSIPWVKISDMLRGRIRGTDELITEEGLENSSAKIFPAGTLLLSIFATIGRTAILDIPAATNQAIAGLRIKDLGCADAIFLRRYLDFIAPTLAQRGRGAAQANINLSILRATKVELPALSDQRRIAAILDKADALRAQRRAAIAKLDELLQSVFIEMFGDPVTNPKGWPLVMLSELGMLDRGISKHRPRGAPELLGGMHPLIQTGDVARSEGYIRRYTNTYSDFGLAQSRKWPAGTLCITIAANIAETGILTFDACFPDSVVGFTPNEKCTVEFVHKLFGFLQNILEERAPQSAQKNINLAILRNLEVPSPPRELQQRFARIAGKIEIQKQTMQRAAEKTETLFASLQQLAFSGKL